MVDVEAHACLYTTINLHEMVWRKIDVSVVKQSSIMTYTFVKASLKDNDNDYYKK